jgi:hypothetical protein
MDGKRNIALLSSTFLAFISTCVSVVAQPIIQEQVRLSKLTLSAFECSLLADHAKEAHRLLEVGFTAGRSFLSGISNLTKAERVRLSGQLDPLWHQVWDGTSQSVVAKAPMDDLGQSLWGPTTDFILGRVYSERSAWVAKLIGDAGTDERTRNSKKASMYSELKCSSAHYHRSEHSDPPTYYRSWHN